MQLHTEVVGVSHRAVVHTEAEVALEVCKIRVSIGVEQITLACLRLLQHVAPVVEEGGHALVELQLVFAQPLGEVEELCSGQQIQATIPHIGIALDECSGTGLHGQDGLHQVLGIQVFAELPCTVCVVGHLGVVRRLVVFLCHLWLVDGQRYQQ